MSNSIDLQYADLVTDILADGLAKADRTGTGTLSVFGRYVRFYVSQEEFPIITTKKMHWKGIVTELLWFLRGDTNIRWLLENDCTIWTGDAWKRYTNFVGSINYGTQIETKEAFQNEILKNPAFGDVWGDLGPIYGKQWRNAGAGIDQIDTVLKLLEKDPDSRRMIVSAWNVQDLSKMTLVPCHYSFQLYSRVVPGQKKRTLDLMWNQRSADIGLGLPYNISSYSLLLVILSKLAGMEPGEVIGNLGDAHIYTNHVAALREQITRSSRKLPKLIMSPYIDWEHGISGFVRSATSSDMFLLDDYNPHPKIKMELSN